MVVKKSSEINGMRACGYVRDRYRKAKRIVAARGSVRRFITCVRRLPRRGLIKMLLDEMYYFGGKESKFSKCLIVGIARLYIGVSVRNDVALTL